MPEPLETGTETGTPAVTPGTTTATPAVTPDTTRTSAATTGFTYQEDRSKWIPPHRLSEETTKRTALETQIAEANRKLAAYRVEAGITAPDAQAEKDAELKRIFDAKFPHLSEAKMRERDAANARAQAAEDAQWKRHGTQQMNSVYTQVAEAIGAESLSDDQKSDLRDSFASWLKATCAKELQASDGRESATLTAYEDGDAKVLGEFVKRYTANWVEPARRKVTAQNLGRSRPVPDSTGRSQITSIKKPTEFKSLDERLDYAAELFQERGGQFR